MSRNFVRIAFPIAGANITGIGRITLEVAVYCIAFLPAFLLLP
jgi:hypothetical protein